MNQSAAGCARCNAALLGREVRGFNRKVNDLHRQIAASFRLLRFSDAIVWLKITTMKKILTITAAAIALIHSPARADDEIDPETCTYKGFPLFGDIQVVDSFPDIKVQIVDSFPDLKVQEVTSFPDDCGQWKFVTSFPDVKIQYVDSFPDIKIKMVTSFPGLP